MKYYSKTTGGFYTPEIHKNIPKDAVEITDDEHGALLQAQSEGGQIVSDSKGKPIIKKRPAPTLEEIKKIKLNELADHRYSVETSGVSINGTIIKTDRESQAQINSAYTSLASGFVTEVQFKGENGWVLLTLPEITLIAKAVSQYVQACFVAEQNHAALINQLKTQKEVENYDITVGWPGA